MKIELSNRVIKDISKLENKIQDAIFNYLELIEKCTPNEIYKYGAKDLKGSLKGLIRFKDKSFSSYRLLGVKQNERFIVMLCCESRNNVYKKKEKMAKAARRK